MSLKRVYRAQRFPDLPPVAVAFDDDAGDPAPIMLWHGTAGVVDEIGQVPRASTSFTLNEARALGSALLAAVASASALRPDQCRACSEPINLNALTDKDPEQLAHLDGRCLACLMNDNISTSRERRSRLRIVEP